MKLQWFCEKMGQTKKALILLHGFGANAHDLAGLGTELSGDKDYSIYYVQAPVEMYQDSYAWFPDDEAKLKLALEGKLWSNLAEFDDSSIDRVVKDLAEDIREQQLDLGHLVIGGFSQGSMVALLCALELEIGTCILFSSALIAQARLESTVPKVANLRVFMSHGTMDPVLPLNSARNLKKLLEPYCEVELFEFLGLHTIPNSALERAKKYL